MYWAARWALRCREDSLADAEQAIEMAGGGFVKAHFRKTAALLSLGRFLEAVAAGEMALAAAGGGEPQQIVGLVEQARKRGAEHKEGGPIEMLLLKAAEQVDEVHSTLQGSIFGKGACIHHDLQPDLLPVLSFIHKVTLRTQVLPLE